MPDPSPAIELRDVRRSYASDDDGAPPAAALDGVDLSIRRGELVAVCGPSGSGKSTLLHLAGVLDSPTEGEVLIDGRPVGRLGAAARARVRNESIGFVFQAFNLMGGLTAAENVALPGVLARRRPADIDDRVRSLLDLVGLRDKADRRPSQLSGGEQQRVAVARALVLDPPILLADEPTGNLDSRAGRDVLDLLLASHDAGRTVVIVTHDQRIAAQAQRVIYLRDGRVVQEAAPARATASLASILDTSPTGSR
jgi:ABC-type lipoprotein export system ATPase subunit